MKNAPDTNKITLSEYIGYGIGPIGKNMMSSLVNGEYLPNFFRTSLHINNGFLAVMLFASKIWDGANDLLMGAIIDHTSSKWGKFRPWIFFGAIFNAITSVMIYFNPGLKGIPIYIYVTLLYILCDATFTMIDVGYWSMIPAMTLDPKERDKLSVLPRVTGAIGGFTSAFTLNIVGFLGKEDTSKGYLRYALIAAAVYIATSVVCAASVRERVVLIPEHKEPFSFVRAARILFRNDQALVVVAIMILFNAAACMHGGTMLYYFTNVLLKPKSYAFYSISSGIISGLGLFGVPLASKKFERNKVYLFSYLLPCIGYLIMTIVNAMAPSNFFLFALSAFVPHISYGAMSMMQSVMLSDAVDYGEWKYGERNEGIIFSMLTFLSKISNGISYLIRYSCFAAVKFDTQVGVATTAAAVKMIKTLLFGVPPVFLIGAFLLHKARFKLTLDFMSEIRSEIKERRAALSSNDGEDVYEKQNH